MNRRNYYWNFSNLIGIKGNYGTDLASRFFNRMLKDIDIKDYCERNMKMS